MNPTVHVNNYGQSGLYPTFKDNQVYMTGDQAPKDYHSQNLKLVQQAASIAQGLVSSAPVHYKETVHSHGSTTYLPGVSLCGHYPTYHHFSPTYHVTNRTVYEKASSSDRKEEKEDDRVQRALIFVISTVGGLVASYFLGKAFGAYHKASDQLKNLNSTISNHWHEQHTIYTSSSDNANQYQKSLDIIKTKALSILERKKINALYDIMGRVSLVGSLGVLMVGSVVAVPELIAGGLLASAGTGIFMLGRYGYQSVIDNSKQDAEDILTQKKKLDAFQVQNLPPVCQSVAYQPQPPFNPAFQ